MYFIFPLASEESGDGGSSACQLSIFPANMPLSPLSGSEIRAPRVSIAYVRSDRDGLPYFYIPRSRVSIVRELLFNEHTPTCGSLPRKMSGRVGVGVLMTGVTREAVSRFQLSYTRHVQYGRLDY